MLRSSDDRVSIDIKERLAQWLVLLAVFAAAFFIRAQAYCMPAVPDTERQFYLDEEGNPYLSEMDSYFYLRKAQEMAEQGRVSWSVDRDEDPMIGQRATDRERGVVIPLGLSAAAYLLWRYLLSRFGVTLLQTAVWMGPVLGSLAAVPAFCYVRRRTSLPGALAAGLLTGFAIPFVIHTYAGFFDTDMVLAFLPLTAVLSHIRCMSGGSLRTQTVCALESACAMLLMSMCWKAWYGYYLFLAVGTLAALLLLSVIRIFSGRHPAGKNGGDMMTAVRGCFLSLGLSTLLLLLLNGKEVVLLVTGAADAWRSAMHGSGAMPWALEKVAEMKPLQLLPSDRWPGVFRAETGSVLGRLGGLMPCLLAALYVPYSLIAFIAGRHGKTEKAGLDGELSPADSLDRRGEKELTALLLEICFLGLWAVIGVILAHRAKRFAEIPVLPVSVLCGLMIGRLFSSACQNGKKRKMRYLMPFAVCLLLAAVAFTSARGAWNRTRKPSPTVTDAKYEAMTAVRTSSPAETALASWWDDGYYMEYQARRRTLSDGGSDNGTLTWFMAKALLTDDPELMEGILRMLNERGTDAMDRLTDLGLGQAEAADLLLRILPMDREAAGMVLSEEGIPNDLLDWTHPEEPAPLMLVLNTDLLRIWGALGYYAFWDPDTTASEGRTYFLASTASAVPEDGECELLMSDEEHIVFLKQDGAGRLSAEYAEDEEWLQPSRLQVWEDGVLIQDERKENDHRTVIVVRENGRCSAVLCSENIAGSMLARLFICGDKSLSLAEPFGIWYGAGGTDPCEAQRRIDIGQRFSGAVQVWELQQTETGGE